MKTTTLFALSMVVAGSAAAQVRVQVSVPAPPLAPVPPAPSVTFVKPPPLVVVQPGIQVVEDHDEEVFFVDNHYWVRRDGHWFRTRDHRGGWAVVDGPHVPPALVKVPPGHYKRHKGPGHKSTVVVNPPGPGKVVVHGAEPHHGKGGGKGKGKKGKD